MSRVSRPTSSLGVSVLLWSEGSASCLDFHFSFVDFFCFSRGIEVTIIFFESVRNDFSGCFNLAIVVSHM